MLDINSFGLGSGVLEGEVHVKIIRVSNSYMNEFFILLEQNRSLNVFGEYLSLDIKIHLSIDINDFVCININRVENLFFHRQYIEMSQSL